MPLKWNHFFAAAIAVTVLLSMNGVPLTPVPSVLTLTARPETPVPLAGTGCAAAALFSWMRQPKTKTAGK